MAAAYSTSNGAGTADAGATTQDSGSVVVPAGATLYAAVGSSDGTPVNPSGVSLDPTGTPQAFTQISTTINVGSFGKFSLWRLVNASGVTAAVRATWGSNQGERICQVWVGTGIDTTTPNGTVVQNNGTGTAVTTGSITTTTGQLVAAFGYRLDTLASTITFDSPSGTERVETATNSSPYDEQAIQDTTAAGSSTTLTWTLSASPTEGWAIFGVPINDAGAGGSPALDDSGAFPGFEAQSNPLVISVW